MNAKWREGLQDPGAKQMTFVRHLFATRAWWKLQPEAAEELVTQGRGKAGEVEYITAACTADGSLAIIYIPQSRAINVDLSRFSAPVKAHWFDPTDGSQKPVQAHALANQGSHEFAPPEKNAAGDSDWVLLLETAR